MSEVKRLSKGLWRRVVRVSRAAAVKTGLKAPPPLQYPFKELMRQKPPGRAPYRWGTLCSAFVAKELGYPRMSVIEFGVAGGNGLLQLERIAQEVGEAAGISIEVYGFDTGEGLPKPQDYRDLPQLWKEGFYGMDAERLKARLSTAELVLGPVARTVPEFIASSPAPVGFVSFDMDMYHSTMDAFQLFSADTDSFLPRVVCYFDDIIGFSHGDFNGERLAISDFNEEHELRKISQIYGLRYALDIDKAWTQMMYMFHAFDHPRYNDYDGTNRLTEIPLTN